MRIPDGWNLIQNGTDSWSPLVLYTPNSSNSTLAIKPGTKATIAVSSFGKDGNPTLSVQWDNLADPAEDAQKFLDSFTTTKGLQQQTSLRTESGLTIEKYYMSVTTPPQNISQPQVGTYYYYVIKKGTGFVWVLNYYAPGQTDYHANVEEALKTITVNG